MAYIGDVARTDPERPAVIMAASGRTRTYGEMYARSNQLARLLHDCGLRRGDRYAILSENNISYFDAVWAGLNSGLYVTAINWHLSSSEAAYIVNDSGAKVIITSAALADIAESIVDATPGVARRFMFDGSSTAHESFDDAIAAYESAPLEHETRGTYMLYSSGTTGRPKGVKFALPDWPASDGGGSMVVSTAALCHVTGDHDVYLSPAPLYHAAPLRTSESMLSLGVTVVIAERFDAAAMLAAIERYRVTSSQWVPTMFVRMLKLPVEDRTRHDLSSLRVAVHAAAPCPPEVKAQMIEWWGPILTEYYSGTENFGMTIISSAEWLEHRGSVGRAANSVIHICDDDGNELPTGEPGTIYFDMPGAEFTYHGDDAKTASIAHRDHPTWRTLGDIGYLDDDDYLYLTDRKAFMIIAGGVNIYPKEIEEVLIMHPSIIDVAVFGIPNTDLGEEVKAVVQVGALPEDVETFTRDLDAYCRQHLGGFKCPRSYDVVLDLPRHDNGKLYKRELRDRYWRAGEHRSERVR